MADAEQLYRDLDREARRLQRNLECCERSLVACCGLTVAQADALLVLHDRGPLTMNEFASEMRLHGTTMTRMTDALVAKHLARRAEDGDDRRVVRVSLTERGEGTALDLQASLRRFYATALAGLPAEDRAVMLRLLASLSHAIEEIQGGCGS